MDKELRHTICRLVAGLVVSDDDLAPEEDAFIERMLLGFGLSVEDRDSIFPIVDREEATSTIRALPPEAQREALRLLVDAASVDGKIAPEEKSYLDAVSAAMELPEGELEKEIRARLPG